MVHTGHTTQANVTFGFKNPPHVLIIEARFYEHINDMMLAGVTEALEKAGATYEKMIVPGALEIPSALQFAAQRKNTRPFDAYVAIGCVIRGETTHYEIVSNESARGIMEASLRHDLAVGNGILTVENEAQAIDRADKARQNKGGGAALAALSMLAIKQACNASE